METPSQMPAAWRTKNVWGFAWVSLFSDLGHEAATALLPGLLLALSAPPFALGVIEGVSNLAQALAGLWGGLEADRSSRRRHILVVGYVLTGLKAAFAAAPDWSWILALRTAAWIGRGARGPIRNAFIADEVAASDRGKAYGFRELFDTLGAVGGPILAAWLIAQMPIRAAIAWTAAPAVLTILIVIISIRDPRPPYVSGHKSPAWELKTSRFPGGYRAFLVSAGIFSLGLVPPTFFILRVWTGAGQFGLPPHLLALALYTVHNLFYAAASYPAGWLADRRGAHMLLWGGYGLWVLVLVGFAWPAAPGALLAALFAGSGVATACIETGQKTWASHLLPESERGVGFGSLSALSGFGQLAAGFLTGALWSVGYPTLAFAGPAILATCGIAVLRRAVRKKAS